MPQILHRHNFFGNKIRIESAKFWIYRLLISALRGWLKQKKCNRRLAKKLNNNFHKLRLPSFLKNVGQRLACLTLLQRGTTHRHAGEPCWQIVFQHSAGKPSRPVDVLDWVCRLDVYHVAVKHRADWINVCCSDVTASPLNCLKMCGERWQLVCLVIPETALFHIDSFAKFLNLMPKSIVQQTVKLLSTINPPLLTIWDVWFGERIFHQSLACRSCCMCFQNQSQRLGTKPAADWRGFAIWALNADASLWGWIFAAKILDCSPPTSKFRLWVDLWSDPGNGISEQWFPQQLVLPQKSGHYTMALWFQK